MSSNSDSGLILDRIGKKIIWNDELLEEYYLNQNMSTKEIAEIAGVHHVTVQQHVKNNGMFDKRKAKLEEYRSTDEYKKKYHRAKNPKPSMDTQHRSYFSSIKCPICGKSFYPAPMHIYRDKKGRLVCNYTCARKGGWNG